MSEIVHVVNGDSTRGTLELAELPGDIITWADALDQGPVLPLDDDAFRRARAAFWGERLGDGGDKHAETLSGWDRAFDDAARTADELVLWYEHDLFDQLALCRLLARLGKTPPRGQVTLVSIDRHDEVPQFTGFGALPPHLLAPLWPRRTPVAREALDEAAAAWLAITAPDPRGVAWMAKRTRVLPFLGPALERHLEELPDAATGLSRTEGWIVRTIDRGVDSIAALFAEFPASERYYLTDLTAWHHVRTLVSAGIIAAEAPLADALAQPRPFPAGTAGAHALRPTPLGKDVLAGRVDRIAHAGIDDWRGGVHLTGRGPVWRFDLSSRRVVFA